MSRGNREKYGKKIQSHQKGKQKGNSKVYKSDFTPVAKKGDKGLKGTRPKL